MSNPVLNDNITRKFLNESSNEFEAMRMQGVALKTAFLLAILVTTSLYTFNLYLQHFTDKANMLGLIGIIGGTITAFTLILSRKLNWAAPLSIAYSAFEGLAIGGLSAMFASSFGVDIIAQAVLLTFAAMFSMLFLYSTRIIKCSEKFKSVILISMFAILTVYLVTFVMSFINPQGSSLLLGSSNVGIGFSIFVCIIAALNFIIDFDTIENAKNAGMPASFEWYGAFSLMLTIVWLYIEILKLLAKSRRR